MTNIFSLKAEELVSKIKDSQLTSVELCERYIERVEKFEKDVKAWAHFDKKLLLEKAAEADEYRRSGKPTGPLHGIPVAVKDIVGTVDMPTECGTVIRKGKSYSQNAEIIDLLLAAGAIVMGKTATAELAYLGPSKTTNPKSYVPAATPIVLKLGCLRFKSASSIKLLVSIHSYEILPVSVVESEASNVT